MRAAFRKWNKWLPCLTPPTQAPTLLKELGCVLFCVLILMSFLLAKASPTNGRIPKSDFQANHMPATTLSICKRVVRLH